jgi:hypothetical protein
MPTRPRIARRFLGLIACAGLTLAACAGGDERRLADFLLLGATGSGGLNTAGWLAAGPGSFELALPPGSERGPERRLRMLPENLSAAPAELRVEVDGEVHAVALGSGERGRLEVPSAEAAAAAGELAEDRREALEALGYL